MNTIYSYFSASTGFASAARMACVLTVSSAMTNASPPAGAEIYSDQSH
ncbi:MAG: hypothetical protein ACE5I1_03715 [bacterium]